MKKRALISVYDKTGVVELASSLIKKGYEIISTGGTAKTLKEAGVGVVEVADVTGFEEILSGRVKTLHPNIFGGILATEAQIDEILAKNISPIDLVVVNLYPFEDASKKDFIMQDLVEYIDIGGVSLLRAAAKNFERVCVLCGSSQYEDFIKKETTLEYRQNLAKEAFLLTSKYDSLIANALSAKEGMPENMSVSLSKKSELRYGENPHQKAALYKFGKEVEYDILNGKELSYNNIVDICSALDIVSEFYDVAATAVIKHNNPCGVALGDDMFDSYLKAFDCDPISAFGGIIAFTQKVTLDIAKHASSIFLEVLVAPDFDAAALEVLKQKKNLRLIKINTKLSDYKKLKNIDIKALPFGVLVQDTDLKELDKDTFKVVSKKKPTQEQVEDMIFAWKVAKYAKSNAIVVAKDKKTLGIGIGQTSRIASMEIALNQACEDVKDAVIASDGFFPAVDNIHAAAQNRIGAIIQPGGSIKDKDVIDACDKLGISMITTSIRHFKH
ncbi:MAG: bifunctional phosphoribosylaminoimidazolecarboxamide formyltransferase/IMP cyclohydrolase [Candidatus Gastranaerophilales bacterium]|nr:bifunctional phosphoribosylaminoimidazolecarboxamide formyltransferase/IMP cyclohydrolase [Candidatus Gastranaerophilales bacterium]